MNTLTKKDIIDEITTSMGMDRKKASDAIETFIAIIKEELERGDDVTLSGFGKWDVKQKHARRGRNPKTGEELTIIPRRVVTFHISKVLREKLGEETA